ncbi:apoptosis-associated speck-like protein containing a CARD isoform X1 [Labeo rohita]|uniref:apoptosis-associated speck-like protein containing a CARD isoform X1 n=1 Tax=Labeo rohita TaxID=84645 RepID=UPI0021E2BDC5|nr:apoptosis-associated speck-like protein containing a CARD isoform X1 [Labeo rohita]
MEKTVKDHLQDIFDDLGQEGQKKFKSKLLDRREEPRVRRAAVEKLEDAIDLTTLMVNTFTETGAVPVTVQILKAIGFHEQANELTQNAGQSAPLVPSPAPSNNHQSSTAPPHEHFIDRHRIELIKRVNNVNAILDELLQMNVITDENYSAICAEKTSQEKMRKLLMGPIKSAGIKGKDSLYKALKDTERCLIEDLEGQ